MTDFQLTEENSKKDEIINALFTCIYENGISGISMRQIAQQAGINLGSLHYYFKSKENLLIEFNKVLFDRFIRDVEARYNPSDSPEIKLDAFLYGGRDFVTHQRELFIVLIDAWSASIRNPAMQKTFSDLYEKLAKVMDDILEEGMKTGMFNKVKKETLSRAYVSFVEGTGLNWHMSSDAFSAEAQFEIMIRYLKGMILKAR